MYVSHFSSTLLQETRAKFHWKSTFSKRLHVEWNPSRVSVWKELTKCYKTCLSVGRDEIFRLFYIFPLSRFSTPVLVQVFRLVDLLSFGPNCCRFAVTDACVLLPDKTPSVCHFVHQLIILNNFQRADWREKSWQESNRRCDEYLKPPMYFVSTLFPNDFSIRISKKRMKNRKKKRGLNMMAKRLLTLFISSGSPLWICYHSCVFSELSFIERFTKRKQKSMRNVNFHSVRY